MLSMNEPEESRKYGDLDLLEVGLICEEILRKPGSESMTMKDLHRKIAVMLQVPEEKLSTAKVTKHIDECMLKHFERNHTVVGAAFTETKNQNKEEEDQGKTKRKRKSTKEKTSSAASKRLNTIERLKGYINKCGVRKIWKRELDGLGEREQILRLEEILHKELGMEGRPTLEKCKSIKERREFVEELKALDARNVLPTKLRTRQKIGQNYGKSSYEPENPPIIDLAQPQNNDYGGENSSIDRPHKLDLSAFGDSEE